MDFSRGKDTRKSGYSFPVAAAKSAHPLPPPPQYDMIKSAAPSDSLGSPLSKNQTEAEKLAALKAYRRAMGQCFKCGDKWSQAHKCSPTVQLHVVQEIWELFQLSMDDAVSQDQAELCMVLSPEAISGQVTPKTLKLFGSVQGHEVVILVDSGSTHTFISTALASKLHGSTSVSAPVTIQVANGQQLVCQTEFVNVPWSVQSYTFHSTLKVLPLQYYDMIVGMEWLEKFSPMQIHWSKKWLILPYNNSLIRLQSELPLCSAPEVTMLEVCVLSAEQDSVEIPPPIQALLTKYHTVFEEPIGLPPSRACDHAIPLTSGAQPFVI